MTLADAGSGHAGASRQVTPSICPGARNRCWLSIVVHRQWQAILRKEARHAARVLVRSARCCFGFCGGGAGGRRIPRHQRSAFAELSELDCSDEPGQAASAPGSAFNEPSTTNPAGGVAGQMYAGNGQTTSTPANGAAVSQYDVACFQVSQPH